MPRYARVVVPGEPHHVTQRGNHRAEVFATREDREVYLDLLAEQCEKAELRVLGFCLMTNHVHLEPGHEAAMAQAIGRTHFRYANYFQARLRRNGHLWQNRFYSCPLSDSHLVGAMLYIEQNPVRAGLAGEAAQWRWSSARFHVGEFREFRFLEHGWEDRFSGETWREPLATPRTREEARKLERCTFAGKPCGEESYVQRLSNMFGRSLVVRAPGRPKKAKQSSGGI